MFSRGRVFNRGGAAGARALAYRAKKPRHLPVSGHNNRIIILCKIKYTHSTIAYSALLREATLTIYKLTRVRLFDFIICIPPFLAFCGFDSVQRLATLTRADYTGAFGKCQPRFFIFPTPACTPRDHQDDFKKGSSRPQCSFSPNIYASYFALSNVIGSFFQYFDFTTNAPFLQPRKAPNGT